MMIDRRRRVKIGDFGLARRVSDDDGSLIKGTTRYMAPEVVSEEFGDVGPASDLYSLGFAMYELLCGENFESLFPGLNAFGRDKQIAWMMWHAAPDRRLPEIGRVLDGVPEDLARCIEKLSAKSQAERYKSADEALSDLNIDVKLVKTGEEGEPVADASASAARRKRMLTIGAFAASLVLSLLMLFLPAGGSGSGPSTVSIPVAQGIIREVVVPQNKLIIEDDEGIPAELVIGDKPRIRLNDERGPYILLRDLKKGDRIQIRNDKGSDGQPIVHVLALRPERSRGRIKTLDPGESEFILAIDDGSLREDVPLRVPAGARISLNGRSVPLADLQVDDRVTAMHLKDQQGRTARIVTRVDALRTVKLVGFIREVDLPNSRITVEQRAGRDSQIVVLKLEDRCPVRLNGNATANGRDLTPADLSKGDRAVIEHDIVVTAIDAARREHTAGVLMALDEAARTMAIQSSAGKIWRFSVAAGAELNLSQTTASFSDLRKYDQVEVTFDKGGGETPIAKTIDATRPVKPDRLAIIVGVQNYHDKNISRLAHPVRDARLLQETLIRRYAFAPERILFLPDADQTTLQHSIPEWLDRASNLTQVLVYFAGHGYSDDGGAMYVAPSDVRWNELSESAISLQWLAAVLENCAAREKILLLDTSHGGIGSDVARQPAPSEMIDFLKSADNSELLKTTTVIGSCQKGEIGADWKERSHGLFAFLLAEAFAGPADKNRDLSIDARELFAYLQERMVDSPVEGQPRQTPVMYLP
jgi:hypothetical protein